MAKGWGFLYSHGFPRPVITASISSTGSARAWGGLGQCSASPLCRTVCAFCVHGVRMWTNPVSLANIAETHV